MGTSEIGQLLLYLLGAHARRIQLKERRTRPILGIFMDGDKVFFGRAKRAYLVIRIIWRGISSIRRYC